MRYADDHLLGFTGPKAEAEEIKQRLAQFLRDDLKLELSQDKTLITHARTGAARFLGYEITVQHNDTQDAPARTARSTGRSRCRVPRDVIKAKCAPYLARGKPAKQNGPDQQRATTTIVATYGAEYRGIVQYYLLAGDVFRLHRLRWVMETSMLKTLAAKHRSTVSKMAAKHKAKIETPHGPRACFEARIERKAGSHWSHGSVGFPSNGRERRTLTDREPVRVDYPHKELIAPAPGGHLRDLRKQRARCKCTTSASSPTSTHAGSRSPEWAQRHGQPAPQDPRGLRHLPRPHPSGTAGQTAHAVVTGEPDDRETVTSGSAGGRAEKDLPTQAPRRAADPTAWLTRSRRLARDYERLPASSEAMILWSMTMVMTRRLGRCRRRTGPVPTRAPIPAQRAA